MPKSNNKPLNKTNNNNKILKPLQRVFVQEYLKDLNATQAAIRAGYSKKTAHVQGPRLLGNVSVSEAIYKAQERRAKRTEITQDRVLKELAMVGFADLKHYVSIDPKTGIVTVKDFKDIKNNETRVLKSIKQTRGTRKGKTGDTLMFDKRQIELNDKMAALKMIGQHLGMFIEHFKVDGRINTDNKLVIEVVKSAPKKKEKNNDENDNR